MRWFMDLAEVRELERSCRNDVMDSDLDEALVTGVMYY